MAELLPVASLVERILETVSPLPAFPQPLMDVMGLALAEDVVAAISLPRFDNAGMDGYAVVHADVVAATEENPVHLPVVGEIGAGQAGILALSPGTAVKIMTGAPVPAGASAVVPYEWTDRGVAKVQISQAPRERQHIRPAGEDVQAGDMLLEAGTQLGPRHLGLLAAVGRATVLSRPRPRVVIISTGTELREPGSSLSRDSIYDANSFLLAAAARAAGAIAYRVGIVPDDPDTFTEALTDQLVRADLIVTTGGVSEGDFDVVKETLASQGSMWFGKVAMQPGKPQGFGTIGEDDTPVFTLPGNPVSAYVSFEAFVLPAIRRMMGLLPYERPTAPARLTHAIASPAGKVQFVRAVYQTEREETTVTPLRGHGSHLLGDLAQANAIIVIDSETTSLAPGDTVAIRRLDEEFLMPEQLSHIDDRGAARMVDVSDKAVTARTASASGRVLVSATVIELLRGSGGPKGDTLAVARLAGIMGAKQTPALIPLCHPLSLSGVNVDLVVSDESVDITATVRTTDRTGVEMEALTAVTISALTVIDMIKAVDKSAVITDVRVETKSGGKSGDWSR